MTTTKTGTKRISGELWEISELAELLGLDENSVKQTPPEVLRKQVEMKKDLEQTKEKASKAEAKAKAKTPAKKSDLDKRKKKLRKFLGEHGEATETSQIISEIIMAPWKGAKEVKAEFAPDHSRTFSTPVHDAKVTLHALIELDLLDEDYLYHLTEQAK